MVTRLPPPLFSSVSPGPGREVRNGMGWSLMEKTARSGVWLFRGAFSGNSAFFCFCCYCSSPLELVTDGDFLALIRRMLDLRGRGTVRITSHADEGMVLDGRVRELDRLGNNAGDEAADFGRRIIGPAVIDARRYLSGVCGRWYLVILSLYRFFIASSRARS